MFVYGQVWIYMIGLVNESVVSLFFYGFLRLDLVIEVELIYMCINCSDLVTERQINFLLNNK